MTPRPIALVTGVGRAVGIAAGIVDRLAADGWDVALTWWSSYDERMPWGSQPADVASIEASAHSHGARVFSVEADLSDPATPARLFEATERALGTVTALVLCHAESVDSGIRDTSLESFDRHFAVNARASWLLVKEFADRRAALYDEAVAAANFPDAVEPAAELVASGRIVALTSDHTAHNLPYGASKGALDRIVIAAATELAGIGVSANVVNPGPIDTGWMTAELRSALTSATPAGRLGTPRDTAALVSFLLSHDGGWVTGQLLKSDGGFSAPF